MRMDSKQWTTAIVGWLLAATIAGCNPGPPAVLSPTAEEDPDRYSRATRDSEAKVRKDREDERKAFRRKGRSAPSL